MSDASYGFLSILRRGLAARIAADAPSGPRVSVTASLSVAGQAATNLPSLALRGAGDVIGFDTSCITRVWPTANAGNAEPNYFAIAELSDADLPWRYTSQASTGDRLTPWLCVIVVKDSEIQPLQPATQNRPLAILTVNDMGALPDLTQAWAWAHAQILGAPTPPATDFDAVTVAALQSSSPQLFSSRLICPRKLDPETSYLACIVPTFERGRLAGLGLAVDGADRAAPAWASGASSVTLPVYYSWRFQTGQPGDFASLVHLLVARSNLPAAVWQRNLSLSTPGVAPPVWQTVGLEGALRTLDATHQLWPDIDAHGFTAALAGLANRETPTLLGPTLYGQWLAATAQLLSTANATPPWFHQLNGDPRARVAAGLGTLVAQTEQQSLLAQAWMQVDGIRRINQRLRLSQLARELATRLYTRHLSLSGDALLQVAAPLHGRVLSGTATVRAHLGASPIVRGAIGAAWRRAARPLGSLGARQGRAAAAPAIAAAATPAGGAVASATAAAPASALMRMNAGTLSLVPAVAAAASQFGDLGSALTTAGIQLSALASVPIPSGFTVSSAPLPPVAILSSSIAPTVAPATTVAAAPMMRASTVVEAATSPLTATGVATTTATTATIGTQAVAVAVAPAAFVQAASAFLQQVSAALPAGTQWVSADLAALGTSLTSALHPKQTIEAPLAAGLTGVAAAPTRADPIEPVMAAPDFPQPMYQPLAEQSTSWLIPGLNQVPPNTVATLTTNWPFVEAYLVGLNHELARKLLWNGYPTDQRGTYFRHFWDIRSRTDGTTDGDIAAITQWSGALGANRPSALDPLVLMVRGDLIRRYPNVVVYVAQGVVTNGVRAPGPTEKQPIFFARLDPDVGLFGFDLDPAVARADPGWYFVLAEHPSEPRFGLAAPGTAFGTQPASWDVLGWDHLAVDAAGLGALRYIDLNAALPLDPAAADSAGAVWHAGESPGSRAADLAHLTFRRPQRLAIHASMLIPAGSTS
jgi:hypothetical protein